MQKEISMKTKSLRCASTLLLFALSACAESDGEAPAGGGGPVAVVTPPPQPAIPPVNTSTQTFPERILNNDGTMNWPEWENVARNYHTAEMLEYRLGPSYADLNPNTSDVFPTIYQPEPNGLWKGGLNRALADRFCQTPDRLIESESPTGYGDGAGGGGGWQLSGQLLFAPDADAPSDYRAGSANMRAFDGARAARASDGETVALCMRLRAEWLPDYWNRNNISAPTTPTTARLRDGAPGLPLPPIATARGQAQSSITGFLAFQNGVIAAAGTGNDSYCNGFASGTPCETAIQLPPGKVPTALALTAMNEFLLATVWDVDARKGQLAVIAVGPNDPANIGPADTLRYGWGVQSWPEVRALKLLGFIDLPMNAPMSLGVSLNTGTMKFRGFEFWRGPELRTQQGRIEWNQRSDLAYDAFQPIETQWKSLAAAGYAVVGSRAENRVALVDLRPLLSFYRAMYLTTEANWQQTANTNQGPAANQWPYTFDFRPEQRPVVLGVIDVPQPTAVFAWQKRSGTNTLSGWVENSRWNQLGKIVTIASMDGTIRQYDVASLVDPALAPAMPTAPLRSWASGPNPTQITSPIAGALRTDDLYIVSRGSRRIFVTDFRGNLHDVLADSRLVDPVAVTIGPNQAGFGGAGPERAISAQVMTVLDFDGKTVHDYGIFIEDYARAIRGGPPAATGPWAEQWPYLGPDGRTVLRFNYGFGNRLPGKPFAYSFDEVI